MTNLTLYAIADNFLADIRKMEEADLDDQTFADTLEAISGDLEEKAKAVAMFARNLEASAEAIKQAEKQMADRRKALENKAEKVRQYILDNMLKTGISKIDCPYFSLSVRKNPPAVDVIQKDMIPTAFFDIPPMPAPQLNKNRLKDALKNGEIIDGAKLTQTFRLEIK